jgi:hypothetical protein
MTAPTSVDPFSLVLNLLWDLLEAKTSFTDDVQEANRIKVWDKRNPFKDSLAEASVPEVIIVPRAQSAWQNRNSGGCGFTKSFLILVSSGNQGIETIFPVEWGITKAMYDFETTGLALTYGGEEFVKDINITDGSDSLTDDELMKTLKGWSAIYTVSVLMHFSNTVLRGA